MERTNRPQYSALEGRFALEEHRYAAIGMAKAKAFSMQAEPIAGREGVGMGVEIIPEDRMPDMGHMDAQLVRSPGFRGQPNAGLAV